jgi:protein SCO1/2
VADAASSALSGRRTLVIMVAIVLAAAIPAVVIPMVLLRKTPELPDLGTIPAFSVVDERGQPFTEAALRGHATIASFLFTRCDTVCPVNTQKMARVQEQVLLDDGVKLLSISVDPAYDTPARLAAYADKFHADPTKWRFVTGDPATVHALIEGGFLSAADPDGKTQKNGAPSIAHAGYFVLVDPELHIRGTYGSSEAGRLDELVRDARYLARTGRQ